MRYFFACLILIIFCSPSHAKYRDDDWNVTMYQQCSKNYQNFKILSEGGDSFLRVSLDETTKIGRCNDKHRQRSELATQETMSPGNTWEYSTKVRFNNELKGEAIFLQVHAKTGPSGGCYKENGRITKPPVKLRLMNNMWTLSVEPGSNNSSHQKVSIDVYEMFPIGKWTEVKLLIDLKVGESSMDLYIGNKKVLNNFKLGTPNKCIEPWGKVGLYRNPYLIRYKNRWEETEGKDSRFVNPWEKISVDYDDIKLSIVRNIQSETLLKQHFTQLNLEVRKKIQKSLFEKGYYNSTIDGLYGKLTERALRKYNKKHRANLDLENTVNVSSLIEELQQLK